MEVYIEYVILDNVVIDSLVLYFTALITGIKFKGINCVLAVVLGTAFSLILPFIQFNTLCLILIKCLMMIIICLILKKYANFREFLAVCIAIITFTFLFGGVVIYVAELLDFGIGPSMIMVHGFNVPISSFIIIFAMYFYLLISLIKYARHKNRTANFYYDVVITQNNKQYYLRGYLDTGNKLYDNASPIVVIPAKKFFKVFKDYPIEKIALGKAPNNPHYINVKAVSCAKILVMDIDTLNIKQGKKSKLFYDVKLGISSTSFSSDFDVILHSTF